MTYTTKTDAYLQRLDSKVRTTVPYTVTDIRNNVVAQEKVVAFTGTSLSIKDLEKIVGVVTGENNYFLEEQKSRSYNSPDVYSVVKKSSLGKSKTLLSFEQTQLPLTYSPKRFGDLLKK